MAKWADLLKDKNAFPDDFVVSVKVNGKDETLSLGEMRAYDTESKGQLTADLTRREQEMVKREKNVTEASKGIAGLLENLSAKTGLTTDELIEGKIPTKKVVAAAAELDESDPLVGALVKEIKTLRAELTSTKGDVDKVRKEALGPMLNTYLEDFYEGQWEKIEPTLPKGASVKREDALKYAQDNGYKDGRGRLDLRKAAKDLTYDARVKAEAEKMAIDLRKKDDDAKVLASVPKPSGTHINVKPDKSLLNAKGQTKSIDEALMDAANDTEMWRGIAGQA